MPQDDYDSEDNATGESRYKSYSKSSNQRSSILKSSIKKVSQFSDDDDDNYNSGRLSSRANNRYDSPINSTRSDIMTAKPPTGRLSKEYGSKPKQLPAITYSPPSRNYDSDDDSVGEKYNRFSKKDRNDSYESSIYKKDKYDPKNDPKIESVYDRFPLKNDSNNKYEDKYDSLKYSASKAAEYSKQESGYDKYDRYKSAGISRDSESVDSKYDKYSAMSKTESKDDLVFDRYDKYSKATSKYESKYDTYDEEDIKKATPMTSTKKSDIFDEKPVGGRNARSSSLDRLNVTSNLSSTLSSTMYSTSSKLTKFNSTNNLNDNASERSYTANSLNTTTMSVKEAKSRSFLVGSLSALNGKGLLSSEELDRHFVDRKAKILVATWNMGGVKKAPSNLEELVLPDVIQTVPDLIVLGVQEFDMNQKDWEISLQEQIGPTHVKLASYFHGSIGITIFVKRELIWFCSVVEFEHINFRAVQAPSKTKGSVIVSFQLFGTLMCFVCSHFNAGEGNLEQRIENYKTTISNIKLPKKLQTKNTRSLTGDGTDNFDTVFWFGDMNFLVNKERDKIERKVNTLRSRKGTNYDEIINHDELNIVMTQDKAFRNFIEGRITFEPTYKYDVNTDNYDTSHKVRIPSYCDRILFRSRQKGSVSCYHYDAIKEIKLSDHRPVFGLYEVSIRPGVDKVPLSYGEFDRQVYAAGYQRRQMFRALDVGFDSKKSSPCVIQ